MVDEEDAAIGFFVINFRYFQLTRSPHTGQPIYTYIWVGYGSYALIIIDGLEMLLLDAGTTLS